ncbi:MAG: Gfo/Idh/MocA family oxidoreductase [Verrucomicrobia bacterium]|nr:Gfo/Idh/MocA family oxidoreductase [Verrucomicrobiota bacterium]
MAKSSFPSGTASQISRRNFLKNSSIAVGATALSGPFLVRGQNLNERIRIGVIGAAGKGSSDTDEAASCGGDIVSLCDVDKGTLAKRGEWYPKAARYQDYRKMLEQHGNSIDAVTVSTPDHHHAPAAALAMRMGKHAFVQKPLVQTVYEARVLRQLAKDKKLATQMGNQGSAGAGLRRAVEVIQAGVIGKPHELHVWSNRPIWPQGIDRPQGEDPVPDTLDWDVWVGPASLRPFKKGVYHPFAWRGWRDFGTGALGDMACHTVNMPFRALKLGYPTVVECEEVSDMHAETYPKTSRIRFEFPDREGMPPLKFWWYDGNPQDKSVRLLRPPEELTKEILDWSANQKDREGNPRPRQMPGSGCLIIGDKGKIFSPDDYGSQFFLLFDDKGYKSAREKNEEHEAIRNIPQTIPRSPGHMREWFNAMKGGDAGYSNFDIAAYLTEIILLGCVALRVGVGKKLDWDGPNMRAKNAPQASQFVKREYRKGWSV